MGIQLYDVMPGRPFGRGTAQSTITSDPNTRTYGTSSGANVTLGSAILSNGDLAVIHQSWGSAGVSDPNWEPFVVASGGGTTSIVAEAALSRTYTNGAQIIKVPEYLDLTIGSAFGGKSYGSTVNSTSDYRYTAMGGINVVAVRNKLTINAVINQNGYQGYISNNDRGGINENQHFYWWYANAPSGGHIGGANSTDSSSSAIGGNSQVGYNGSEGYETPIWNGGCGARNASCGAGGGHANVGSDNSEGNYAHGGLAVGNTDLTSIHMGGGGGGAAGSSSGGGLWTGGSGGGIWIIYAREVAFGGSGGIQVNGGLSYGNNGHAGGSGAGGSVLINCERGAFGTNLITATAGATYDHAGAGSVGRIRLNYGSLLTGTTNPSASVVQDTKLVVAEAPAMFFFD